MKCLLYDIYIYLYYNLYYKTEKFFFCPKNSSETANSRDLKFAGVIVGEICRSTCVFSKKSLCLFADTIYFTVDSM